MINMRRIVALISVIALGCASHFSEEHELEPIPVEEYQEKNGRLLDKGGPAGGACATGCVWSLFSVAVGAQKATHDCDGFGCACVMDGYVHQECEVQAGPDPSDSFMSVPSASLGGTCAPGCIWSSFAVSIGAQDGTAQCESDACACVSKDNVYVGCVQSDEPEGWGVPQERQPAPTPPPAPQVGQPRGSVPHFSQWDNRLSPEATCQNTSIAIVLAHYGWRGNPDDITSRYGRRYAQSPPGLADLFNQLASQSGINQKLIHRGNGTMADVRALLDQGKPVIVHGYFTGYGHVLVVTGYDANGYYVNDPAGVWSQIFRGGYGGGAWQSGKNVYYSKAAFEAAVATSDGRNFMPVWYHELQ